MKKYLLLPPFSHSLKVLFVFCTLFGSSLDSNADVPVVSFQVFRNLTGSGLGGNVSPSLGLTLNKSTLTIGPSFQRRKMNCSGVEANYMYAITSSYCKKIDLYFLGTFAGHSSAFLSRGNIEIEKRTGSKEQTDVNYEEMKLKVVEGYLGVGLNFKHLKPVNAGASISLGGFDTLNKNYNREMYRDKIAMALQFQFQISYNFKSKN